MALADFYPWSWGPTWSGRFCCRRPAAVHPERGECGLGRCSAPHTKAQCWSLIGPFCGSVVSSIVNKSAFSWPLLFGHADHVDEVSTRNTPRPLTNAAFVLLLFQRLQGKWQSLTENLLPRSRGLTEREAAAVAGKRKEDGSAIYKSEAVEPQDNEAGGVSEAPQSEAAAATWTELNVPVTGERLFVFRCPPESCGNSDPPKRKKKRNFLNLRKGSVAPTDLP